MVTGPGVTWHLRGIRGSIYRRGPVQICTRRDFPFSSVRRTRTPQQILKFTDSFEILKF